MNKNSLLVDGKVDRAGQTVEFASKLATNAFSLGILSLAIIALAFSPVLTKLSEIELSPTATIFNRLWIATVIVGCWQLTKTPSDISSTWEQATRDYRQQGLLFLASLCATVSAVLWAVSFTQTSVASSTVLRSFTPLFISLTAWLFLKQRFDRQFIVGTFLAIAGGMAIGWDDLQLSQNYLVGDGIALLSAALHGVNILIIGYVRDRGCPTARVLLWRCAGGTLIAFPLAYLTDTPIFPTSLQSWLIIIALAVVCQTFGQGLLIYSLQQFSASFVGVFALLKPLITAVLAWIIFAEEIGIISGVALVSISFGIYLAKSSNSPQSEEP